MGSFTDSTPLKQLTLMKNKYVPDTELSNDDIDKSMLNGYFRLIHNESINDAFIRNGNEQIFYPFHTEKFTTDDIQLMIDHFASDKIQEYERCIELQQYMKAYKNGQIKSYG